MGSRVTKIYAQALFDLSLEVKKLDVIQRDLKNIEELMHSSLELCQFLQNPVIPSGKRREIINIIFKKQINSITLRLILLLSEKKRLKFLSGVCDDFNQMYLEHKGIATVIITSGISLNEHQINVIKQHLKKKLDRDIRPLTLVDPKLIGGIAIRHGNTIYDYSFRAQLERIRKRMITV